MPARTPHGACTRALPLAIAVLLSVVIAPTAKRLERIGVGRLRRSALAHLREPLDGALLLGPLSALLRFVPGVRGSLPS